MNIAPCNCRAEFRRKPKCINSRTFETHRWRRYVCPVCSLRWSTVEIVVPLETGGAKLTPGLIASHIMPELKVKMLEALLETVCKVLP